MKQKRLSLRWEGTFIELCMSRVNQVQKSQIDSHFTDSVKDVQSTWYDNTGLLKRLFGADNWWSIDDLDHAMGFIFADRSALEKKLATMTFGIDGTMATIDPDAFQLSFYTPEAIEPLDEDELVVCHGSRQDAILHLDASFEPPFDPSLITLSFLYYPDDGYILIDLDYDGHDDVQFKFGDKVYLKPRFFGKDHFNGTSR
jgi:hypothetical protein